jgi:hypothetical protein
MDVRCGGSGSCYRGAIMEVREPLTVDDAEALLADVPLVPAMSGSMDEIKRVRAMCLAAGVPVRMGCPPGAGKG